MSATLKHEARSATLRMIGDEFLDSHITFSAWADFIDHAHLLQFRSGVDTRIRHHPLGFMYAYSASQQAHAAATREKTKHDLWESKLALLFGNKKIRR